MPEPIHVIDYDAGNAPSVGYALERIGCEPVLAARPEQIADATRVVLPGVGSARATMDSLRDAGMIPALEERVLQAGVPFLGICIGLQILFEQSEEDDVACLGWLPGRVRRFGGELRVPQIGWNSVRFRAEHPVLDGIPHDQFFYFVNSYYVAPDDPAVVLGETEYGETFCSLVARGNILAAQFHVEKSGPVGLRMLQNFTRLPVRTPEAAG